MAVVMQKKAILILSLWVAYVIALYIYFPNIAKLISESNIFVAFLLYIVCQPLYIGLGYSIWEYARVHGKQVWRRILASICIVIAGDVVALPRLMMASPISDKAEIATNLGAILMNFIEGLLPHGLAFFTTYIIVPIVFVAISLELLGVTDWIRQVKG